jgi:hypothetical protein
MYRLADPDWIVESFRDDLAMQMSLYIRGAICDVDRPAMAALADALELRFDCDAAGDDLMAQLRRLLDRYAQRASIFVLGEVREFARRHRKQLLVVLFDPFRAMYEMHRGEPRHDAELVDHLRREGVHYFDMNDVHLEDFKRYRIGFEEYVQQFFVGGRGHYNPRGNHFFAYAIKDTVVRWLDPPPITYRDTGAASLDFEDYLFDGGLAQPSAASSSLARSDGT